MVLSLLVRFTASDYLFGIFWPLYCLSLFDLQLLITSLVSFGHCVVCPCLIYSFWIPLWYLLAIVLSVLVWFTASDYLFGIFWPLCSLSLFDLQLLITSLVSFGHCVVCPCLIYSFWLPLWYLLAIVLSVLVWFTASDYLFGIFWPLCCLSLFDLQLLITSLVSFGHCIVCPCLIYSFWLPLWYLLAIVLSVLVWFTASDYLFGIFWPLCCLSLFDLQLLITSLVSFGHCIVCPCLIYSFWLPLWYLLAIVLSVLVWFTASDYLFGIFWPLYCLSLFDLQLLITSLVSFGHCVVCPCLIYSFWIPLWYLLAIVLSVLVWFTASDYLFGIFWPLCCLSLFDLQLLITSLVSFGHSVVCPCLIYSFWLPLWYLLAIVLSVLVWFTASDYLFGIFWPLYCLSLFDLQLLITSWVSFGHCIVCPCSIYSFWLPLWYLLAIVLSVLVWFTASDYLFGIFWPLYCLFFDLQLMITSLVSFGHCIVCPCLIYSFWLPLWYLLAIVLSVLVWFTASDYLFGIFWPLCCLSLFDLQLLITSLVSFGHCIVSPCLIYSFWLPLWYLLAIVLSVLVWFTASDYLFGIFWPLYCLSLFDLQLLITSLVSFGHCVVCPCLIYSFWLPLWYLLAIVLSVLVWFTASDYLFGIFWPLCCLSLFDLQLLITSLVTFGHGVVSPCSIYSFWLPLWYLLAIVLSVLVWFTASDYLFGIFWPLYCLSLFDLQLLVTSLVSFGHCVVCPCLIYSFWIPLWYLLAIVLSVLVWFTASDYLFGIFWPLCCLSLFDLQLLITSLVSFGHCIVCPCLIYSFWLPLWYLLAIVLSVLVWFTASDYLFGIFWPLCCLSLFDLQLLITSLVSFGHCVVCPCLIYSFWLPLWYLLAIVLSVLVWFTASDYLFGIFWPLCCLSLFDLQLLITSLVSFGHCVVCPCLIYSFWLPLWYLLAIVLSVLVWFTASDYLFGIFWPLCCLSLFDLQLLITSLVSFGHCVVCPCLIYSFWLPLWYLLAIVLSVLVWFTASDYLFGIFWPLYSLSLFDLQLLITSLVSFGHCVVCSCLIYSFWIPLWYLLAIVLSVLVWFTASDYLFGIFWPFCCLSLFDLQLLITSLVSFGHCIVCPCLIYSFWLPLWYLLAIVFPFLVWFTASDYLFGNFWPWCCLSLFDLQLLITSLVSFGHCIVCPCLIYSFWLPLWYLLAIVLSVLVWFTASDYLFGIFWPLYCLSLFDLQLLITSLVSFGHCVVCPCLIYSFWLPLWYLLAIVLSVLVWFTASDYLFGIFWPLCCLSLFDLQLLITSLVSFGHCIVCPCLIYSFWLPLWYLLAIVLSVLVWFTASDYLFGIFWPLCCLSLFDLQLLITSLVSFGHCIVCPCLIYSFWLPLWYLLAIVLSVLVWFTASDYLFGIFWPLYCLSLFDLQLLITSLVSFGHCVVCPCLIYSFWLPLWYLLAIVLSVLVWFTASDYLFGIFWPLCCLSLFDLQLLITSLVSFGHCVVCPCLIYSFWLPLWYLLAIVLSVLVWFTASDYLFGIFWPLCCLSLFDLQLLITSLVSFGHCVVCPCLIYSFWLPLWYLLAIVLSVLVWFTASDYLFGIFWPLSLVSFGHWIVCPCLIYSFWLPLWYLLAIVLSVLVWFTASDYLFGIFWPLYCLSLFDLQLLITSLVSFGHCIVCPCLIYSFWLPLWYLLAIVLSVLVWFTASDYLFGIFWPLYCLSLFDLQLLITSLVSFGHCIVCPCLIYSFWLPLWYLLAIVLPVLVWFTASDYLFGIFWSLCCLSLFDLQLLITSLVSFGHCILSLFDLQLLIISLVSFGHCIVCPCLIYSFWLPLWYLLAIVLSVLVWFTASDYLFGIFWPLYCLSLFDLQLLITSLVSFGHCVPFPCLIYSFWLPLW